MDYETILQIEENSYTIDELLKAYYVYFQMPMVVIDKNYEIKGQFHIDNADETYLENIKRGSWSIELISIANSAFKEGESYKIIDTINSSVRRLFYRLALDGNVVGWLVLLESGSETFDQLDSSVLDHLAKSVIKLLRLQSGESQGFSQLSFWKSLVNHSYIRRDIFLTKAAEFKIPLTYNYRILLLSLKDYDKVKDNYLQSGLKNILHKFFILVKENYVIIILDRELKEYEIGQLNDFFFANRIYAILSSKIIDLYTMDVIINNLIKLFIYLIKVTDEYRLQFEEENKLLVPLLNAPDDAVILNYINETVLDIYLYDQANNTFLLDTVYQYLLNNRSLSETSKILFIHKNTVMYRLDRVKDLFNIDFGNPSNNLSYMYSIAILNYLISINSKDLSELKN